LRCEGHYRDSKKQGDNHLHVNDAVIDSSNNRFYLYLQERKNFTKVWRARQMKTDDGLGGLFLLKRPDKAAFADIIDVSCC
jgi:hypothetical protein